MHSFLLALAVVLAQADGAAAEPAQPAGNAAAQAPGGAADAAQNAEATPPAEPSTDAEAPPADQPAESDEEGTQEKGFWESGAIGLLVRGGPFMWPILILGILALGVIIERYRSLRMLSTDNDALKEDVLELLHTDEVEKAMERCDAEEGPVPAILSSGLRKYFVLRKLHYDPEAVEEQVVKAMDDYSVHVVAALEKHLPILATISSVAPMLGFLGTVAGMIVSFDDIVAQMGEKNIVEAAAAGISQALLTTCFGLIIGIPAYMAFNYFSSVINRFVLDVEQAGTELIEAVTFQLALDEAEESPQESQESPRQSAAGR